MIPKDQLPPGAYVVNLHETAAKWAQLLETARNCRKMAYCVYSGFAVGAALWAPGHSVPFGGANCENVAYGSTLCAERAALTAAVSAGARTILGLAIIGGPLTPSEPPRSVEPPVCSPCGACRQMLFEFAARHGDFEVLMTAEGRSTGIIAPMRALLPLGFGPAQLGG